MSNSITYGSINYKITASAKEAKEEIDDLSGSVSNLNKLFGLFKVSAFVQGLKQIGDVIGKNVVKQSEYIQSQNLFNKTMGDSIKIANEFRDQMETRLGIDPKQVMDSMNAFKRLSETFGLSQDRAYLMSKNLTQLAADMTAYGYSFENAMQKLKSGLAGEIEPMRAIGVALDKATLQQTMYSMGIDRTYDSLTRAQKTELLYYQIMTQTVKMQSELGRTLATPSQAVRIMKQEFTQLARAVGSIFIPIMMKIIPVVRAVVQVLTKAAKSIASFFGFEISDYVSDYEDLDVSIGGISDGLDDVASSASGAAKEMNKMLMPFDELNNINFTSGGSSGGGGVGGGGLGGSLFDTLPEYNIFDSITRNIDKEVNKWKKKIEELLPVIKGIGIALATAFAIKKIADFVQWISSVKNALSNLGITGNPIKLALGILFAIGGIWSQYQGIKKMLQGDFSIWTILETLGGTALGTFGIVTILRQTALGQTIPLGRQIVLSMGLMLTFAAIQTLWDGISTGDVWKQILGTLGLGFAAGVLSFGKGSIGKHTKAGANLKWSIGIAVAVTFTAFTIEYAADAFKEAQKLNEEKVKQDLGLTTGSGALAGAAVGTLILPGLGTAVGASLGAMAGFGAGATGAMLGVADAIKEVNNNIIELDENSEYLQEFKEKIEDLTYNYDELKKSILENRDAKILEANEMQGYLESLDKIIDENGHVKEGYEELAEYILKEYSNAFGENYKLIDGVIYKNDQAIGSYAEFRASIDENIKKMKEEAEQAANIELYKQAYSQRKKLEQELKEAKLEHEKAEIELTKAVENGIDTQSDEFKELNQHFLETGKASSDLKNEINKNYKEITDYSVTAFGTLYNSLEEGDDLQAEYLQSLFTDDLTSWEKIFDTLDDDQKLLMLEMSSTAETWNPKLAQKWQEMADKMPEKFRDAFGKTQAKVNDELGKIGNTIETSKIPASTKKLGSSTTAEFNNNTNLSNTMSNKLKDLENTINNNKGFVTNAIGGLANNINSTLNNNINSNSIGKNIVDGIAKGINEAKNGTFLSNAIKNLSNAIPEGIKKLLKIESPSKLMRDEVGKFIPMGIAVGIDKTAYVVEDSMEDLANKIRVDEQQFDFYNGANFVSSINGKIQAQTSTALNENTLQNMASATYEGMTKALNENTKDYNPQFNVYVGNDKIYSGYSNYQSNASNRYGVKV